MGMAIGFESGTLEYPATTKCERDDRKIAYFNQAPFIKLLYTRANGKNGGHTTRPDFLVVEAGEIGLVECKMEAELVRESQQRPWLYERQGVHWISPPGQRAASHSATGRQQHSTWPGIKRWRTINSLWSAAQSRFSSMIRT